MKRLHRQIQFLREIDRLKEVTRQSFLMSGSRQENSAEHSWHVATMAMILDEYANDDVDVNRVIRMLLLHDVIEIDAGDTYIYDEAGNRDKAAREALAAERIFSLLPDDQAEKYRSLWQEYENQQSAEAKFAASLDRLMPLLHNYFTGGKSWKMHGIKKHQVLNAVSSIRAGSEQLWQYATTLIEDAVDKGFLADSD